MNIILLSGGSGSRLWPLSNTIRSKQFIKIFKNQKGIYESMVQRVYRQIIKVAPDANIIIATSKAQVSAIQNQLGDGVGVSIEPCRRDTFPAIALAGNYLQDVQGVNTDEVVVICPVDPYVEADYFEAIRELSEHVGRTRANLSLLGIQPIYPSEKYGYIIPKTSEEVSQVLSFKEKPNEVVAKEYIEQGGLWNGGIFACKLEYLINKSHELIEYKDYKDLFNKYDTLNKISFDYAVVENEKEIDVFRFGGEWKDVGTWNTLAETMSENTVGNVIMSDDSKNTHVINELDLPVLCMGTENLIVSASVDGILVSSKEKSSYIKPYVDEIIGDARYAEKSWGEYRVLDASEDSLTVKVTLNPGHQMNYHSHERRDEVWSITRGEGYTVIDGIRQKVKAGDVITMKAGCKHTIIAITRIELIEVQLGKEISVSDKKKYVLE